MTTPTNGAAIAVLHVGKDLDDFVFFELIDQLYSPHPIQSIRFGSQLHVRGCSFFRPRVGFVHEFKYCPHRLHGLREEQHRASSIETPRS